MFLIFVISVIPMVKDSIEYDFGLRRRDTRTLAKEWVEERIREGSRIYIEGGLVKPSPGTVPLNIMPELVDDILARDFDDGGQKSREKKGMYYAAFKEALKRKKTYHLILTSNKKQLVESLERQIGGYVILREKTQVALSVERNRERFPEVYRLLSWVNCGEFELIKTFEPGEEVRGQKLLVYRRVARVVRPTVAERAPGVGRRMD